MRRRSFVTGAAAFLGAGTVGSVAFSTATVERDVRVGVTNDTAAALGLEPGSTDVAFEKTNGELAIDTSNGSYADLNPNSSFSFGTGSNIEADYVFSVTNNTGVQQSIQASYTDSVSATEVSFDFYDGNNTFNATVDENNNGNFTLTDAETLYAQLNVSTGADGDSVTNGILTFNAP